MRRGRRSGRIPRRGTARRGWSAGASDPSGGRRSKKEAMRIAIFGAGISGLAAAHLLAREHDITVFEAGERPADHSTPVRVATEAASHHVDTGFIVFNDRNYPNFERLLTSLRVPWQKSDMSFGVSDGGDFEYSGAPPHGL